MQLADVHTVKQITERYGFTFSKDFGQNFLIDPAVPERIADAADVTGRCALEIGPGIGTLTRALAARAKSVVCLELDRRLLPILAETLADCPNVRVRQGDVLGTDLAALGNASFGEDAPAAAVSNLPYCITTPAVLALLSAHRFYRVTVMIQKEAARKLLCRPGDPEWCLFSAKAAYYGTAESAGRVTKGCFYPAPTVDSQVVSIDCTRGQSDCPEAAYMALATAVFAARRKSVRNTLSALPSVGDAGALLARAGIDPARRGETLTPDELARMASALSGDRSE